MPYDPTLPLYGSLGAPQGTTEIFGEDQDQSRVRPGDPTVMIGGKRYLRVGDPTRSGYGMDQITYDPQYGYLLEWTPERAAYTGRSGNLLNRALNYGPSILGLGLGAATAFGGTAAGATEAGLSGMDLAGDLATSQVGGAGYTGAGGSMDLGFFGDNPEFFDIGGGGQDPFSWMTPADYGEEVLPWTTDPSLADLGGVIDPTTGLPPAGTDDWWKRFIPRMGGGGSGGSRDPLSIGLGLLPAAGMLAYGLNMNPYDTSRQQTAFNQVTPEGLTGKFDLETAAGRDALTAGLQRRGVMGSSFAPMDIANYDMTRGVGRQNLLTGGALAQNTIANSITGADIAHQEQKNKMISAALLAASGALGTRQSATEELIRSILGNRA